jgi:glycosyltransferase involved in cell wall biosynthesis
MNSIVKKDELEKLNDNSKKVRELYSWDVIVANYYNYFKKLVNE